MRLRAQLVQVERVRQMAVAPCVKVDRLGQVVQRVSVAFGCRVL